MMLVVLDSVWMIPVMMTTMFTTMMVLMMMMMTTTMVFVWGGPDVG